MKAPFATLAVIVAMTSPAQADLMVKFIESAPKDSFTIVNASPCPIGPTRLHLDLATSAAGLIFDTTATGAGVEVFQPFQLVRGEKLVRIPPVVKDGDTSLALGLDGLEPNMHVTFTIDVDDTRSSSPEGPTMVSGSEIEGAIFRVDSDYGFKGEAPFNQQGLARIPAGCAL